MKLKSKEFNEPVWRRDKVMHIVHENLKEERQMNILLGRREKQKSSIDIELMSSLVKLNKSHVIKALPFFFIQDYFSWGIFTKCTWTSYLSQVYINWFTLNSVGIY